jgi:protein SCO1/2
MRIPRIIAVAVLVATGGAASVYVAHALPRRGAGAGGGRLASVNQTVLPSVPRATLRLPSLTAADGGSFGPERMRGRWTVAFFGYTACPDVCPNTLMVLSQVAQQPASGVPSGKTQLLFVSIQPEGDTPPRVKSYLKNFDSAIIGLTGSRDSIVQFARAVGASSDSTKSGLDHSTSLFVIDPDGKLAGVLLRPSNAKAVVDGLNTLRAAGAHDE